MAFAIIVEYLMECYQSRGLDKIQVLVKKPADLTCAVKNLC
jgi:hypothetical protein